MENTANTGQVQNVSSSKSIMLRKVIVVGGALALVALGAVGVYAVVKQKPEWLGIKSQDNQEASQEEVASLIAEVGKIIDLPTDQVPTIATVSDIEKVKDQQFFKNAKEGDKVLVYANAKKAILYRPTEKKIIEVGVVNLPSPTSEAAGKETEETTGVSVTPSPSTTLTVSLTPKPSTATVFPTTNPTSTNTQ